MKINYLAYYDPFRVGGSGGQHTERLVLMEGTLRGHKINVYAHDNHPDDLDCDLWFISDWYYNNDQSLNPFLSYIKEHKFVCFSNAYETICGSPYAWHLRYNPEDCFKHQCPRVRDLGNDLFAKASLAIFVSPLHRDYSSQWVDVTNPIVLKIEIGDIPTNCQAKRNIEALYVGTICEAKGWEDVQQELEKYDNPVVIGAWRHPFKPPKYWTSTLPRHELFKVYHSSQRFIALPAWPEPRGLVVDEAMACGCEIIANDNVGALSYKNDPETELSVSSLWDRIAYL